MILIGLGANLPSPAGPPAATLSGALGRLKQCGIAILSVSSFYQTPAWPDPSDPAFVNAVASVATRLQPAERSFVLMPLAEIAPGWQHPLTRQSAGELLANLADRDAPKKLA